MIFLFFAIEPIPEEDVEQGGCDSEGVDLVVVLDLACSFEEEIDVGEPYGEEVDDDGDNGEGDVEVADISDDILFVFLISEFVLPLFFEVVVGLVVDWKVLAEVFYEMLFQEILASSV